MTQRLTVSVHKSDWLTMNGRYHWAVRRRRTSSLRERGAIAMRSARRTHGLRVPDPAIISATIHYPRACRADPHNAAPTVKALIDGFVDGGALPDDDSQHLVALSFGRGEPTGRRAWYEITFEFMDAPKGGDGT